MKILKSIAQFPTFSGFITLALIIFSLTFPLFSEEVSAPDKSQKTPDPIAEEIRWLQAESVISIATKYEIQ